MRGLEVPSRQVSRRILHRVLLTREDLNKLKSPSKNFSSGVLPIVKVSPPRPLNPSELRGWSLIGSPSIHKVGKSSEIGG